MPHSDIDMQHEDASGAYEIGRPMEGYPSLTIALTAVDSFYIHRVCSAIGTSQTCADLGCARCHVLEIRGSNILLDCAVWPNSALLSAVHSKAAGIVAASQQSNVSTPSISTSSLVSECLDQSTEESSCLGPFLPLLEHYELEAVLLTTAESVLGVPYLLAAYPGQSLIQGPIYATVAAIDAARHLLAELPQMSQQKKEQTENTQDTLIHAASAGSSKPATGLHSAGRAAALRSCRASLPKDCDDVADVCWLPCNSISTQWAEECFRRIKAVQYGQVVPLDGVHLTARACPTGASMGSASWIIFDGSISVGYLSDWQLPCCPSSFLEIDMAAFNGLEALILAPLSLQLAPPPPPGQPMTAKPAHLTQTEKDLASSNATCAEPSKEPEHQHAVTQQLLMTPQAIHQSHMQAVQRLHQAVMNTVAKRGRVIIPLPANGVAWSVIEGIAATLQAAELLASTPIIMTSPSARNSLALAMTSMEFLSRAHQARPPGQALQFQQLIANNQLLIGNDISDPTIQQALHGHCVLICPVASLGNGATWNLLQSWSAMPDTLCVLSRTMGCDPAVVAAAFRAALPDMKMGIQISDVGGPPPTSHFLMLLSQLQHKVKQLVTSDEILSQLQQGIKACLLPDGAVHPYRWLDVVEVPLPKQTLLVNASPTVLQRLQWAALGDGAGHVAAQLAGLLVFREGAWQLVPMPGQAPTPYSLACSAMLAASRQTPTHRVDDSLAGAAHTVYASGSNMPASRVYVGQLTLQTVISALKSKGLDDIQVQEMPETASGLQPSPTIVIKVLQLDAEIWLKKNEATIRARDNLSYEILEDCLSSQLLQIPC